MVHFSTVKYLIKNRDFHKILLSVKFYIYDKIKRIVIDKTKKQIVVNNCQIEILPNDEGISTELLIHGIHEPLTTYLIMNHVKPSMTVLDIGSNIGYYATLESKLVTNTGNVISIEPSPINFRILEKNLELQKMENYQTFNLAIGDKNGEIEFLISEKSNWSKIREKNYVLRKNEKIIRVPVKTLDTFCEENLIKYVDLIRMDVEGYEKNIISGAKETLKKFKPMLMIEVHKMYLGRQKTQEFLKELSELGYEIKYFYPRIFDSPIIGNKKDIKKLSILDLLKQLENNTLPEGFQITLIAKD